MQAGGILVAKLRGKVKAACAAAACAVGDCVTVADRLGEGVGGGMEEVLDHGLSATTAA